MKILRKTPGKNSGVQNTQLDCSRGGGPGLPRNKPAPKRALTGALPELRLMASPGSRVVVIYQLAVQRGKP